MRVPALLIALGVLSCADANGPSPRELAGKYVLVSIAGEPLPAIVSQNADFVSFIHADTFTIDSAFGASRATVQEFGNVSLGGGTDTSHFHSSYRYRSLRGGVELTFLCPSNAGCVADSPLIAEVTRDGLAIVAGFQRVPLTYVRITR